MSIVKRIFCPACGAPVNADRGEKVVCEYCGSVLLIEGRRVSESPGAETVEEPTAPPPSSLLTEDAGRFEVSLLEQLTPHTIDDGFSTMTLPEGRFALIFLRLTDPDRKTLRADYDLLCRHLRESLDDHEDPGLAAYELLERICDTLPDFRLEVSILLFDPLFSSVTAYNAGTQRSTYWVSGEEGRVIDAFNAFPALERKMLRMSRDHFSNSNPVYLTGSDLVVGVSAAYAGRGGGPYSDGTDALVRSLNQNLGEHPLKVVTLAKNAFWNERSPAAAEYPLSGPLRVAAVRARASVPPDSLVLPPLAEMKGSEFEVHFLKEPSDHAELVDLHDSRQAFLWLNGEDFNQEQYQIAKSAILKILDRPDYGDNENPRRAGREGMEEAGGEGRMLIVLLINKHGRAKWFRRGWGQPLGLGARGLNDPPSAQKFDEGGEATVPHGTRLLFPGNLPFLKPPENVVDLARTWTGGKASALYSQLFAHWRVPRGKACLKRLVTAALADVPEGTLDGCCLLQRC